jgi:hypothetical protein
MATLLQVTSLGRSFAVIFNVVGQRAALQGNTARSNIGVLLPFLRPKLSSASAFNEHFLEL